MDNSNNTDNLELDWGGDVAAPSLTPATVTVESIVEQTKKSEETPDPYALSNLNEKEKNAVLNLVEKIDITDSSAVVSFGSSSQEKIASFSDSILKSVRTKDVGATGDMLSSLVVEIKNFDAGTEEKTGIFGIFNGIKKQLSKINANYEKVEVNIDKIVSNLENHKVKLLKDNAILDEMYNNNYTYYKELTLYVIAGKEKIKLLNEVTIPELRAKAESTNDEIDIQKLNDMVNFVNRFEKKIHDLMLTRMISIQMAPQIRLLQNNNTQLIDKIQSSIVNSIPLWKNQIVIALGLANSKAALESQRQVSDMTNDLLKKNSQMLKQGSIEVAKESERSIISIETIKQTNNDLIETIYGVIEIQEKGRQERAAAETQLMQLEEQFKTALLNSKSITKK